MKDPGALFGVAGGTPRSHRLVMDGSFLDGYVTPGAAEILSCMQGLLRCGVWLERQRNFIAPSGVVLKAVVSIRSRYLDKRVCRTRRCCLVSLCCYGAEQEGTLVGNGGDEVPRVCVRVRVGYGYRRGVIDRAGCFCGGARCWGGFLRVGQRGVLCFL